MAWKKLGLIYSLPASPERSTTHMQGPVAILLEDRFRIFFAARNAAGKSYAARLDVSAADPTVRLDLDERPLLPPATDGAFDDDGVMPACAVRHDNALWLYYSGWNRRVTVPYHNTTGLATSLDDGLSFERPYPGPLLDRTPTEPWMAVTPWVLFDQGHWKMWYVSGLGWLDVEGHKEPVYTLKYAVSPDGVHWQRDGLEFLPRRHAAEAIARPCVILRDGLYHLWYSYRDSREFRDGKGSYRIGYAQSRDGLTWQRADALSGIDLSPDGWDSKMICYPYVVVTGERLYLFYNGNGFGQTGIGCAVWEGALPVL